MTGSEIIVHSSGRKVTHFSLKIGTEKDSCSPAQPQYQAESRGGNAKIATGRLEKTFRPCQSKFSCWGLHVRMRSLIKTPPPSQQCLCLKDQQFRLLLLCKQKEE